MTQPQVHSGRSNNWHHDHATGNSKQYSAANNWRPSGVSRQNFAHVPVQPVSGALAIVTQTPDGIALLHASMPGGNSMDSCHSHDVGHDTSSA